MDKEEEEDDEQEQKDEEEEVKGEVEGENLVVVWKEERRKSIGRKKGGVANKAKSGQCQK